VSESDSIRKAANHFATIADHLDVLINNAGIYPDEGTTILSLARDSLVETFQTNTFGPLEVTRAFLPYTPSRGRTDH
jgi:NAD(P)-dependent dehydrogenase (short-subunit alcohol dehydrogenase family)